MTDDVTTTEGKSTSTHAPNPDAVKRFERAISRLPKPDPSIGLAVSGGPDSLALLLLAAAARPGRVKAATVDHGLRDGSRKEAEDVAALCRTLGVPHEILTVEWDEKPTTAIQERARKKRYDALERWARREKLDILATGHHADDQAETLLMRLARGSGVKGLAGMRGFRWLANGTIGLARPLLGWTRKELGEIVAAACITPAIDPSNSNPAFERVRVRDMLATLEWLDPKDLARSAYHLTKADRALSWAARKEWPNRVSEKDNVVTLDPSGLPDEIARRLVRRIVLNMRSEGAAAELRGAELDRLLLVLVSGRKATLRGVLCGGGKQWRFAKAPARKPVRA